jgi:lambda family phage portal protein
MSADEEYEVVFRENGDMGGLLPPPVPVASLPSAPFRFSYDDGEKFPGGFGPTELLTADYWTLRARSSQLFERNLYARGLVRRLVTNEINTGLHLEAVPEEKLLGYPEDALADWAEDIENRFAMWERRPAQCDRNEQRTFGQLQAAARAEALIAGDVLVVMSANKKTGLPRINLVSGSRVQTPPFMRIAGKLANGNRLVHGVEIDADGKQVAFWVRKDDSFGLGLIYDRLAANDSKGRRNAWLVYGTDRRLDAVRGKPILSLVLQSLNEIDRYRDSVQRKAVINAILAMWIEKGENLPASRAFTSGAVRKDVASMAGADGKERQFRNAGMIPGLVVEELQHGEKIHAHQSHGTDERFGDFEQAIIQAVAWANEIPPEILMLSFGSNYAASQAAINEFKIYLNRVRTDWGASFCQPIYEEWLLAQVLERLVEARGLLEAWRDAMQHVAFGAWMSAEWAGHIKPAVDVSKLVKGYVEMIAAGLMTRDRAARELTGTKYSKNVQKLLRENAALAAALSPIVKLEQPQPAPAAPAKGDVDDEDDDEGGDRRKRGGAYGRRALDATREPYEGLDAEE